MKWICGVVLAGLLAAGCGGSGTGTDLLLALDLLVVTNTADNFSIAGVSTGISGTKTYSWSCSMPQANLTIGSTLTNGSIRLEVFDGVGNPVHDNTYEAVLLGGVTVFTKSGGTAGTWTLRFTFSNAMWTGALTVQADTLSASDAISIGGTGVLDVSWIFQPGWGTNPLSVSIGGVSGGSVRVRIWDGSGASVLDQTVSGVSTFTAAPTGAAGVWTVQLDYSSAVSAGAVAISQP